MENQQGQNDSIPSSPRLPLHIPKTIQTKKTIFERPEFVALYNKFKKFPVNSNHYSPLKKVKDTPRALSRQQIEGKEGRIQDKATEFLRQIGYKFGRLNKSDGNSVNFQYNSIRAPGPDSSQYEIDYTKQFKEFINMDQEPQKFSKVKFRKTDPQIRHTTRSFSPTNRGLISDSRKQAIQRLKFTYGLNIMEQKALKQKLHNDKQQVKQNLDKKYQSMNEQLQKRGIYNKKLNNYRAQTLRQAEYFQEIQKLLPQIENKKQDYLREKYKNDDLSIKKDEKAIGVEDLEQKLVLRRANKRQALEDLDILVQAKNPDFQKQMHDKIIQRIEKSQPARWIQEMKPYSLASRINRSAMS